MIAAVHRQDITDNLDGTLCRPCVVKAVNLPFQVRVQKIYLYPMSFPAIIRCSCRDGRKTTWSPRLAEFKPFQCRACG
jgi:hypothetical protein